MYDCIYMKCLNRQSYKVDSLSLEAVLKGSGWEVTFNLWGFFLDLKEKVLGERVLE